MVLKNKSWEYFIKGLIIGFCLSIFLFLARRVYLQAPTSFGYFIHKMQIYSLLLIFACLHILIPIKKLYQFIYRYRFWLAFIFFIWLIINNFNGSSVAEYDKYIQPGMGSIYRQPLFGKSLAIRSDEWLASLSQKMSGSYSGFGCINSLTRGVDTPNLIASGGIQLDFAALRNPGNWGYYFLNYEHGLSWSWAYCWAFGPLIYFEFFNILTGKQKTLSLFAMILTWFSSFNMWWSLCSLLMNGLGIIVLFDYFLRTKKTIYRFLIGLSLAIVGADFVCGFYPPWQVPFGWFMLCIMIWQLVMIKPWTFFNKWDYVVFIIDLFFMFAIIARFLIIDLEYIQSITSTVYPGKRIEYGGFAINKALTYVNNLVDPEGKFHNPSEMGTFYSFFPLGILWWLVIQFKQKFSNKLLWAFALPIIILAWYCIRPMPVFLVKLLLLTNATYLRAIDIFIFINMVLFIVCLAEYNKQKEGSKIAAYIALLLSFLLMVIYLYKQHSYTLKTPFIAYVIAFISFLGIFIYLKYSDRIKNIICAIMASIFLYTNVLVNPIQVGAKPILTKPAYAKIQKIVKENPNKLWIGVDNLVIPNFVLAAGARTLNSVNYIPNKKLWDVLDPSGKAWQETNRYAHILMLLDNVEKLYRIATPDSIHIHLNHERLRKLNVNYVASLNDVGEEWKDILQLQYHEGNFFIYKVIK